MWLWSKGGERDVYGILKHKTRAPLGALFKMQTAKCLSSVTFHCHCYSQNSVQKIGDKAHIAPFEEMGLIVTQLPGLSNTTVSYQAALGARGWMKSGTDMAHIWEKKFDRLKTQISSHSSFHCSSAFSYLLPLICSRSLPFSRKPPLRVLESKGSRKEHSPVQQPSNNDYLQLFGYITNKQDVEKIATSVRGFSFHTIISKRELKKI